MPTDPALDVDLARHRPALLGHCYRMLGSVTAADDAVQETLLRAWRARAGFEGRSSVRTWLTAIATRVCLDASAQAARRERPVDLGPAGTIDDALVPHPREAWVEPIPDALITSPDDGPEAAAAARQSVRLAFVAALQRLGPSQRAALLLTEVAGMTAGEAAAVLGKSEVAVQSAVARAKASLRADADTTVTELPAHAGLVDAFADAFARYDLPALTALLTDDATLSMPPFPLWLQGHEAIAGWLLGRGIGCRGSVLVPVEACGSPAFGQYKPDPEGGPPRPWSLVVLELRGGRVRALNHFLDTETLFPIFGLPPHL